MATLVLLLFFFVVFFLLLWSVVGMLARFQACCFFALTGFGASGL